MKLRWFLVLCLLICISLTFGQANKDLQIHFMDVGQGDGAILISPEGETVLFDGGPPEGCAHAGAYMKNLGVTKIDYLITSHYHADHIGCASELLSSFPLSKAAYDRGGSYNSETYRIYVKAVGSKREPAVEGMVVTLDANSSNPVTIRIAALNGNGIPTTNENDLSVVAVVKFGRFDAEFGGDLSGYRTGNYEDIESSVAPKVGQVEVYKVHHHCSNYSTNPTWLQTVRPRIAIVSVGDGNTYGHPAPGCLERLHSAGVKLYWTEKGSGGTPEQGADVIAGDVFVQVEPNAQNFKVSYDGKTEQYPMWEQTLQQVPRDAWSKNSTICDYAEFRYMRMIDPGNLARGDEPFTGKVLHQSYPLK
jgi:beta-lactamase superfamily II metal-dependent hydrolase